MVAATLGVVLAVGSAACGTGSDDSPRAVGTDGSTTDPPSSTKPPLVTTPTSGGADPGDDPGELSADQVVWQERNGGGFVPIEVALSEIPQVTIYGDGRIYVARPEDDQPYGRPPAMRTGTVAAPALAAFVHDVERSGLFGPTGADFGTPPVTDGPTTTVRFQGPGSEPLTAGAYFLTGDFEEGLTDEQVARRDELRALIDRAAGLADDLEPWAPERLRVTDLTGEAGDADPEPTAWPGPPFAEVLHPSGLDGRPCGGLSGDAAAAVAAAVAESTSNSWMAGGEVRVLVISPLLPGEEPCPDR
ncbi:MAG: hypothetical protein JWM47_3597 [Acidimicrobiales bacterium]|nr:hypothetical protein [Acidimicrobiales bacterium]